MRGVTKASLRQKTTNNIPTYVETKSAFLTQYSPAISLRIVWSHRYMVLVPVLRKMMKRDKVE